jgi:hypothetical protein
MNHENDYHKLVKHANKLGYEVVETDCDSWDFSSKIISNNKKRHWENRVIYLSHEVGHASLYSRTNAIYFDIFPGFSCQGIKKKVSQVEQEVLAWEDGLKILQRLKIPINLKQFARIKTQCLKSWIL